MIDFYPNFIELNNEEKLVKMFNPLTPMKIRTVAYFITVIRTEGRRPNAVKILLFMFNVHCKINIFILFCVIL